MQVFFWAGTQGKYDFRLEVGEKLLDMDSKDAADAVAACVTLGYAIYNCGLEDDWGKKHTWISNVEWEHRFTSIPAYL